jgi:chromosome segregation ATPase
MEKAVLEREKDSVEKEFNQNRDILEKLSNDVRALTARQEQLKGQHQFIVRLLSAFEKEEQKVPGKILLRD